MNKIKEKFSKVLSKNSFIRSVSVLVGGTATSQVISILASPFLTRLYSTEDFGLLAVYGSIIGIVGVIASLRYELAIPIAETDKEAASLVYLSGIILIAVSITTGIVFYAFSSQLLGVLKASALKPFLWLLPLSVFFMGLYNILNYWAIRTKQFGVIAKTKFAQSFSSVAVQLSAFKLGAISLLFGQLMGQTAGNTTLFTSAVKPHKETFKEVKKGDIVHSAKRWKKFPLFSTWDGLFNAASSQLPPLLFATFFSPAAAGVYMLAHRVLNMPMVLIGNAVSNVFFSKSAEAHRNNNLAPLVAGIHEKLAYIAMPPLMILMFTGPKLFSFIFGENWVQAGEFAQWMVPWLYLVFITSPLSQLFSVLEKQKQGMCFNIVLLAVRVTSLFVAAYFKNLILAVALFSLGGAICWVGFLLWIAYASGNTIKMILKPTTLSLLVSLFISLPVIIQSYLFDSNYSLIIALSLSTLLICLRYISIFKRIS